jgi:hypothetical protein
MYGLWYFVDEYAKQRMNDYLREAECARLAAEVAREGRSLRARLADCLYKLAARVEGQPRRVSHEGAPLAA